MIGKNVFGFEYEIDVTKTYRVEDVLKVLPIPRDAREIRISIIGKGNKFTLHNLEKENTLITIVRPLDKSKMQGFATFKNK